jgi:hypothetical protein
MQENLGDQDMIVSNQMAFMDVYNTMMKNTIERTGLGDGLQWTQCATIFIQLGHLFVDELACATTVEIRMWIKTVARNVSRMYFVVAELDIAIVARRSREDSDIVIALLLHHAPRWFAYYR